MLTPCHVIGVPPQMSSMLSTQSLCTHCNVKLFACESLNICCSNGTIKLLSVEVSSDLNSLFTSMDQQCAFQDLH